MSTTHNENENKNNDDSSDPFVLRHWPSPYPACVQRPRPRPVPPRYDPPIEPRLIPHVMGMIANAEIRLGRMRLRPFTLIPLSDERVAQLKEEEWTQ